MSFYSNVSLPDLWAYAKHVFPLSSPVHPHVLPWCMLCLLGAGRRRRLNTEGSISHRNRQQSEPDQGLLSGTPRKLSGREGSS
jgi:hypothetical protein